MSYKVLIINGGGIFGYIPAYLLSTLQYKGLATDIIHAFGGCSIGGCECLYLAQGKTFQEMFSFFSDMSEDIFKDSWYQKMKVWGPRHDDTKLNSALQIALTGKYKNLTRPVIVPCVDFKCEKPKVFDNILPNNPDLEWLVWEIARCTMAAPTYFKAWKNYIDGGIYANMPVVETACALKNKLGVSMKDMSVLILGTGEYPCLNRNMDEVNNWTQLQWLQPMIHFLIKGNELRADFISKQMPFRYYRYFNSVMLDSSWDIDDTKNIPEMKKRCDSVVNDFQKCFNEFLNS